ncbi:MAG: hypothetical protein EZS28_003964 [Streblomastix strix]|uniref:Uncharacterized protein n=1 Tax=Streblomastix strix TaxID=222440 RepID=A0A5J4WZF7_9EUKA|nr:MAG: hypothetical protein EZS28_003964 [Streblomastix strix]
MVERDILNSSLKLLLFGYIKTVITNVFVPAIVQSVPESMYPKPLKVNMFPSALILIVVNEKGRCTHIDKRSDLPTSEITSDIANC